MSDTYTSASLTPTTRMSPMARLGATLVGIGTLALITATATNGQQGPLPFIFGLVGLVAGGILLTLRRPKLRRLAYGLGVLGICMLALTGQSRLGLGLPPHVWSLLILGGLAIGAVIYYWARYAKGPAGVRHDGTTHHEATRKNGVVAWVLAVVITGFYVLLYWFPAYLQGLVDAFQPVAYALFRQDSSQWFVYGLFYTVAVLVMGLRFIFKNRHNRYQIIRTCSLMFFQLGLAFALPGILEMLHAGSDMAVKTHFFSYFWPLDYDVLFPAQLASFEQSGYFGAFVIQWTLLVSFVAVPVLTYFFGKRWYCSWVCGCGGLAETAGDPFRHLSDKSLKAWRIERVLVHGVLLAITLLTVVLLVNAKLVQIMPETLANNLSKSYGFAIGSVFSGVIGVGFYPLMGSRVWCRFGCPQAAILGLLQKWFSRFRITTNGAQCISCGNCSTYCEMGIDVKWYAQRGQNIVRASCVGCGVCSAVCPRGVLKLESGPVTGRTEWTIDEQDLSLNQED